MGGGTWKEWVDGHKNSEIQGYMRQKSDAICSKSRDPRKTVGKRSEVVNRKLSSWRFVQPHAVWAFIVKGTKKKSENRALD